MKNKTLLGITTGIAMGAIGLVEVLNKKLAEAPKPILVAEFIDRNNDGNFDSYILLERKQSGQRCMVKNNYGKYISPIVFYSPFGGEYIKELDKMSLINIFRLWHYPDVDEITFLKGGERK